MLDCVTEPQTRAEMIARYKAARSRLNPKPAPEPAPEPVVIEEPDPPEPEAILVPTMRSIQVSVAKNFDVPHLALLSHRRLSKLVFPRMVSMWLCDRLTLKTVVQIGRAYNGRDHSTVLHAIKRIDMLREIDPHVRDLLTYFIRILEPAQEAE